MECHWPLTVGVSHKLKLTSLGSHLGAVGHSLPIPSLYASLCLHEVGVVCRRGEYKPGIYSDHGQCPASRGNGKTVFST